MLGVEYLLGYGLWIPTYRYRGEWINAMCVRETKPVRTYMKHILDLVKWELDYEREIGRKDK
jgi:hypothetical protein